MHGCDGTAMLNLFTPASGEEVAFTGTGLTIERTAFCMVGNGESMS